MQYQTQSSVIIILDTFSEKFNVEVENLPSALKDVEPPIFCEPWEKKGKMKMTANSFCVTCGHKFCAAHQEVSTETSQ